MKAAVLVLIVFASQLVKAQVSNNEVLIAFVKDPEVCKNIPLCSECDTIFIVDTLNLFNLPYDRENRIYISSKYLEGTPRLQNTNELIKWRCHNLFINGIERTRKKYKIYYYHSATNGVGYVEFELKKKKFVKTRCQFGQL